MILLDSLATLDVNCRPQLLVPGEAGDVRQLGQGLPHNKHLGTHFSDLELVELLIANVVGDVLNQEEDDGFWNIVMLPSLDKSSGKTFKSIVLRNLK